MHKDEIKNVKPLLQQHIVGGRAWRFVNQLPEYQLWTADYWCPDGDGVELYIGEGHFKLSCFSGIGNSKIIMDDLEFVYVRDKVKDLRFTEPFELQCVRIADYFCRLFCNYHEVGS